VPVAFLTELEARRWGRFGGEPTIEQLDRFFHLDADDLRRARRHRGESTVLGFAVQVGTLRFLGTFLAQVEGTPRGVISYVGHQLKVGPEAWTGYPSSRARELHPTEIRNLYGYTAFGDGRPHCGSWWPRHSQRHLIVAEGADLDVLAAEPRRQVDHDR
jgi:hypothetical protein